MKYKSRPDKKSQFAASVPTVQTQLQSRPWRESTEAINPELEESEVQTESQPREGFGHNLADIPIFSPTSPPADSNLPPWQIKPLTIGAPGDKYEQEADQVAPKVVSEINQQPLTQGKPEETESPESTERSREIQGREIQAEKIGGQGLQEPLPIRMKQLAHLVEHNSASNMIQLALQSPRFSGNTHLEDAYNDTSYIKKGHSGLQVRLIQQALLDAGYSLPKYGVDGQFGSETKAAVEAFQTAQGLTDDGIVGPNTMKALDNFFLNHGAMAGIPQGQVPSTPPTEGVEWNSASIPSELLAGTRTLTTEEKAEVERRRTTEVKAPKGGSKPVFQMNIATHTDSYEARVEEKTNNTIDWLYNDLAKGKADARKTKKDRDKNLYKWDIVEKIASLSKTETDRVFGNYAKGTPLKAKVNLKDAWAEKEKQFAAGGKAYEDSAVEWRVNKIFGGRSIRKIDREHGAVQSRATEKGILTNIRNRIISKRRAELIEIHKGWPGFAGDGKVYLQRFVSADDAKNRDNMWDLFQTVVHEYIHTLEHSDHVTYRQTLGELKGGKTYREGMTEYFTKIVLESVTYNDSLRQEVEGPYHDPKIKHPIPRYRGYDEAKNAEAVVGVVGIKNAMAAFFAGRVDLIGG